MTRPYDSYRGKFSIRWRIAPLSAAGEAIKEASASCPELATKLFYDRGSGNIEGRNVTQNEARAFENILDKTSESIIYDCYTYGEVHAEDLTPLRLIGETANGIRNCDTDCIVDNETFAKLDEILTANAICMTENAINPALERIHEWESQLTWEEIEGLEAEFNCEAREIRILQENDIDKKTMTIKEGAKGILAIVKPDVDKDDENEDDEDKGKDDEEKGKGKKRRGKRGKACPFKQVDIGPLHAVSATEAGVNLDWQKMGGGSDAYRETIETGRMQFTDAALTVFPVNIATVAMQKFAEEMNEKDSYAINETTRTIELWGGLVQHAQAIVECMREVGCKVTMARNIPNFKRDTVKGTEFWK